MSVDVSAIPTAAVERIDIETDGASAIYGADAVAGVVNIILKKNYDGEHTGAYVGDTADGGLIQRYSQLVGRSFDKGRGGAMFGYQFQSSEKMLAAQRRVSRAAGDTSTLQPQDKSQSLFLSSHYGLANDLQGSLEGVYNHRTSLDIVQGGDQQGLEDQFWGNGGLKWDIGSDRTVGVDVTYSGDSSAVVEYTPVQPLQERFSDQNRLLEISANGQGKLVRLPGGRIVRMAIGGGATRESFKTGSASSFAPVVNADRRRSFAYVEEFIPIFPTSKNRPGLRRLVLNVAGRFDHYSDFGSIAVPKVQLAYSPVRSLTLSGTWGKSFEPPTLDQLHLGQFVVRYPGLFFGLPAPRQVLFVVGSNPNLRPQTAMTRTVTLQWKPVLRVLHGLSARLSYYDIDFKDQVGSPITDIAQALSNPLYSPFVVEQPSAGLQNSVISRATINYNIFSLPVDPSDVQALVFDNNANVSAQVIDGLDASAEYRRATRLADVAAAISGSWMRFDQRALPGAAPTQIAGTIFNPPRIKSRAMLSLDRDGWGLSMFLNYISSELNNAVVPTARVGSWTTVDGQVRYVGRREYGPLSRMEISFSVQNILNRAPPSIPAAATLPPGIGFDADNYSAIGRFMSLDVAFHW
jgi:iron complex outermembrane receptor protein